MSSDGEPPFLDRNQRATNERVQTALTSMQRYRSEFQQARQLGQPDDGLHLAFQASIVESHDALRPYKDQASEKWNEATRWDDGLDLLPKAVAARPTEEVKSKGFGRQVVETDYRPQLLAETHLLEISYEIDEIAREMGFEVVPETPERNVDGGVV